MYCSQICRTILTAPLLFALGATAFAAPGMYPGEIKVTRKSLNPTFREWAAPTGGAEVDVNPPPLLWPATTKGGVTYNVRLSQDPKFPAGDTISASGREWTGFNAHRALEAGTWHWQYQVVEKGKARPWSKTHDFVVTGESRPFVTPPADEMLLAIPKGHPRILLTPAEVERFRKRYADSGERKNIEQDAGKYLGKWKIPEENDYLPQKKGKTEKQNKRFAQWASKRLGAHVGRPAKALIEAYAITGDEKYARKAIEVGLKVASYNAKNGVSYRLDFTDGNCMDAMAQIYDACYDLMTPAQRKTMEDAIAFRVKRLYNKWSNKIDVMYFNAHVWQHIMTQYMHASATLVGRVDGADKWLTWLYETWINRFPGMGGNDGGWANGNNYFRTNHNTIIEIPSFFQSLTGANFFNHPWYHNTIYFETYTWPPHSRTDGFGDGHDRRGLPELINIAFINALANRFKDEVGGWYVRECMKDTKRSFSGLPMQWHRMRYGTNDKPAPGVDKPDLPQARLFRDVGITAMHTSLFDMPRNTALAFRSSPYGALNHMHMNQNAFNVLLGGQYLFNSTGYYIAYGDEHCKESYWHTRAHNTVLIDGKGQPRGDTAYGWIARFLHGERISYALGDASNAYGDAGLTRFRRHIVFLRPATIVIYDELAADHAAKWQWLLHSDGKMAADSQAHRFTAEVAKVGRGEADLWASAPIALSVTDKFASPADNWRGIKEDGKLKVYPNQWHGTAETRSGVPVVRFLAVIQVRHDDDSSEIAPAMQAADGWIEANGWKIRAEIDPSKAPMIEAVSADGKAALAFGRDALSAGGREFRAHEAGATLLLEVSDDGVTEKETADKLPAMAR